jgi:hypothetical protein
MKRSELKEELEKLIKDLENPCSAMNVSDWLSHLGGEVGLAWEDGEDAKDWIIP